LRPAGGSETMAAVKPVSYTLWGVIALLVAGNAWHFARHKSIGLFEWSAQSTPDGGRSIVRTADHAATASTSTAAQQAPQPDQPAVPKPEEAAPAAPTPPPAAPAPEKPKGFFAKKDPNLISLFDGKSLGKWKPIEFGGEGEVKVDEEGHLEFDFGAIMTGVNWSEAPPAKSNYEISLEAMKLDGNDFFCALTFPVKESHATLVVGGWGGGIVGVSSVDDLDASENETMNIEGFETNVWYRIKVRVTDAKIQAWIDDRQMVDLEIGDKKISLRPGDIELCVPVGIASFMTRAQYKNLQWRNLTPADLAAPAAK
jgi:hypothetical protein